MRIDASELNQLSARFDRASTRVVKDAARYTREKALDIERDAKQFAPVRTGTLKRSIHHELSAGGLRAQIGSNLEYAGYVEFGTSRMAPRAYMGPAFDRHAHDYVSGLARIAGEVVFA